MLRNNKNQYKRFDGELETERTNINNIQEEFNRTRRKSKVNPKDLKADAQEWINMLKESEHSKKGIQKKKSYKGSADEEKTDDLPLSPETEKAGTFYEIKDDGGLVNDKTATENINEEFNKIRKSKKKEHETLVSDLETDAKEFLEALEEARKKGILEGEKKVEEVKQKLEEEQRKVIAIPELKQTITRLIEGKETLSTAGLLWLRKKYDWAPRIVDGIINNALVSASSKDELRQNFLGLASNMVNALRNLAILFDEQSGALIENPDLDIPADQKTILVTAWKDFTTNWPSTNRKEVLDTIRTRTENFVKIYDQVTTNTRNKALEDLRDSFASFADTVVLKEPIESEEKYIQQLNENQTRIQQLFSKLSPELKEATEITTRLNNRVEFRNKYINTEKLVARERKLLMEDLVARLNLLVPIVVREERQETRGVKTIGTAILARQRPPALNLLAGPRSPALNISEGQPTGEIISELGTPSPTETKYNSPSNTDNSTITTSGENTPTEPLSPITPAESRNSSGNISPILPTAAAGNANPSVSASSTPGKWQSSSPSNSRSTSNNLKNSKPKNNPQSSTNKPRLIRVTSKEHPTATQQIKNVKQAESIEQAQTKIPLRIQTSSNKKNQPEMKTSSNKKNKPTTSAFLQTTHPEDIPTVVLESEAKKRRKEQNKLKKAEETRRKEEEENKRRIEEEETIRLEKVRKRVEEERRRKRSG